MMRNIGMESYLFKSTQISKEALQEQELAKLVLDLKRAEERADREGWIDADDLNTFLG